MGLLESIAAAALHLRNTQGMPERDARRGAFDAGAAGHAIDPEAWNAEGGRECPECGGVIYPTEDHCPFCP